MIAEVALSFVLLAGASLLIRKLSANFSNLNLGVDTTNVLAMDLPNAADRIHE